MPIFEERTLYLAGNQCCDQVPHRFIYVRLARDDCLRLVTCARRYTHIHERACPHFRKSAVIPSTHTHTRTHPEFLVGITRVKEEDERKDRRETEEKREDRERKRRAEGEGAKEIYSTVQRMRSFRESGHRHSARNAHEGWELPRSVFWCAMTTNDRRSFLPFFIGYFFRPSLTPPSPLPLSFPPALACALMSKLLVRFVGIAFRC